MTPMQIHWCIVYWCRQDPEVELGALHFNSSAGKEVHQWMIDEKLIIWDGEKYVRQDRLQAFIEHLCAQPLPVLEQRWVVRPAQDSSQ